MPTEELFTLRIELSMFRWNSFDRRIESYCKSYGLKFETNITTGLITKHMFGKFTGTMKQLKTLQKYVNNFITH